MKDHTPAYNQLLSALSQILEQNRKAAFIAVNQTLVKTYWEMGKHIVEYEQKGNDRADYGVELLKSISKDLKTKFGKGFSRSNLQNMRLLFLKYPKSQTLSGKLSWSHYVELLSISDDLGRSFYEKQSIQENWSVRELKRQRNTALFERIALSKDKGEIRQLSQEGQQLVQAQDIVRDPYVFEFLGLEEKNYHEKDLENALIDKLEQFLLELGKGFAFIKKQYRITLDNQHFYIGSCLTKN